MCKKKLQLIETGKELFLKHGTKRVPIEEICRKAKVSKATFYKYFNNKLALVKTIRQELMEIGFAKFDEINSMDITYEKKVMLMSKWRIDFLQSIKSEFLDEIIGMEDFAHQYDKRFIDGIKAAQQKGEIRKNISPELISLITERMREVTTEGKWRDIFDDYATYQDQVRTIVFWGMLTDEIRSKGE